MTITLKITNLDALKQAVLNEPEKLAAVLNAAGDTAAKLLLETEGLAAYPPESKANKPPEPFYIRGRGTQVKNAQGVSVNLGNSQRLGEHWSVEHDGAGVTTVANRGVTYARYVHDDSAQRAGMARIGWRRLGATAREEEAQITAAYEEAVLQFLREMFGG